MTIKACRSCGHEKDLSELLLRAELSVVKRHIAVLEARVERLTQALLERPIPADCPPAAFPAEPAPHIDPPPHHPDHDEHHIMIAALALDPGLRQ